MTKLTKHQAAWEIQKAMDAIYLLKSLSPEAPEFLKWRMEAESAIEYVFGKESRHLKYFEAIKYTRYVEDLEMARFTLQSMIQQIHNYWSDEQSQLKIESVQPSKPTSPVSQGFTDNELMRRAIEIARKSVNEPGKISPKVGAVVARDGEIIGEAHRGELAPGNHAEFILLEKKLAGHTLAGATLYTTLEPCTSRNHPKLPCAQWIVDHRIKKVVIGTLDRNPDIRGKGYFFLRDAGIEVEMFDSELLPVIEELNREFTRDIRSRTEAETKDPPDPEAVGPNGFKIGYTENGDKVEWIEEDGEKWPMILRRNDNDILAEYDELWEKVWYVRKRVYQEKMDRGEVPKEDPNQPHQVKAEERMLQIEEKYGIEDLIVDDVEWGIRQGKLAALAWAMGSDWEGSLDT